MVKTCEFRSFEVCFAYQTDHSEQDGTSLKADKWFLKIYQT